MLVRAENEDEAAFQGADQVEDGDFNIDDIYHIEVDDVEEVVDG